VAEAVELARALKRLPPRLVVYGIEGRSFSAGVELSAEVEQAAAVVVARVLDEMRVFAEAGASRSVVKVRSRTHSVRKGDGFCR
jgi:Ni,Fe-hydrogenase maturation factor